MKTSFLKIWYKVKRKKVPAKIKLIKYIISLSFKYFQWKIIIPLLNHLFNNNITIIESRIMYVLLEA